MATVASTMVGWDSASGRPIRNVVALNITATVAAITAQTSGGDGFDQLQTAANRLEFAVPSLLDSDEVLDAAIVGGDANIDAVSASRSASGASPKVKIQFSNAGANNAVLTTDPVVIAILVARR